MDVYIFQAALLCETCGANVRNDLGPEPEGGEYCYDSDGYPKGPFPDGGGEADSPNHCDHCGEFLENPLTDDGVQYVQERLDELVNSPRPRGNPEVLSLWAEFYRLSGNLQGNDADSC
jgi:hypothetical protein